MGYEAAKSLVFLAVAVLNAVVAIYIYTLVPEFLLRFLTWVLIHSIYRVRVTGLEHVPEDGPVLLAANHVPNDCGFEMIDRCTERLRSGGSLILFPEGTRTRRDRKLRFKAGAAAVAARTDSALLPVLIECEPLTLGKGEPWFAIPPRKPSFRLEILEPRTLDSLIGAGGSERLRKRQLNKALKTFFVERLDGWT